MDPRVEKMASVLVNYCVGVRPNDLVIIQSSELGVPMVDACFRAILQAGKRYGDSTLGAGAGHRLSCDGRQRLCQPDLVGCGAGGDLYGQTLDDLGLWL